MIKEIERKILNNISLTETEVIEFLTYVCELIRNDCGIIDPMDTACKFCCETTKKFGRLMLMRFGCDVDILDIKKLLQIPLTHYANIISFNIDGNIKTYLVDMTYSQFFGDTITLDNNKIIFIKEIFGECEEQFLELRKNGFIELDKSILKKYIDNFLNICNIKDKKSTYINIQKLLFDNNTTLKNIKLS